MECRNTKTITMTSASQYKYEFHNEFRISINGNFDEIKKVIVLMTRFANICVVYSIEYQFPRMTSLNPRSHQSENLREILETLK